MVLLPAGCSNRGCLWWRKDCGTENHLPSFSLAARPAGASESAPSAPPHSCADGLPRHYCWRAPLYCLDGSDEDVHKHTHRQTECCIFKKYIFTKRCAHLVRFLFFSPKMFVVFTWKLLVAVTHSRWERSGTIYLFWFRFVLPETCSF